MENKVPQEELVKANELTDQIKDIDNCLLKINEDDEFNIMLMSNLYEEERQDLKVLIINFLNKRRKELNYKFKNM